MSRSEIIVTTVCVIVGVLFVIGVASLHESHNKKIKILEQTEYEEWIKWSGDTDMPFSVWKKLNREDKLPMKKYNK